jgi:hypothetical protein
MKKSPSSSKPAVRFFILILCAALLMPFFSLLSQQKASAAPSGLRLPLGMPLPDLEALKVMQLATLQAPMPVASVMSDDAMSSSNDVAAGGRETSYDSSTAGEAPAITPKEPMYAGSRMVGQSCDTSNPTNDTDTDGMPNVVELQEGTNCSVKDNDIFSNARWFVMQQYRDFFATEGDSGGISFWTNQISSVS